MTFLGLNYVLYGRCFWHQEPTVENRGGFAMKTMLHALLVGLIVTLAGLIPLRSADAFFFGFGFGGGFGGWGYAPYYAGYPDAYGYGYGYPYYGTGYAYPDYGGYRPWGYRAWGYPAYAAYHPVGYRSAYPYAVTPPAPPEPPTTAQLDLDGD